MSFDGSSTVTIGETTKKSHFDQLRVNDVYLRSGTADFYGVKTFQSGTVHIIDPKTSGVDSRTATDGVSLELKYRTATTTTNTKKALKQMIIEIGDWNMDADASKSVNTGLLPANIRSVNVLIIGDNGTIVNFWAGDSAGGNVAGYWTMATTSIVLNRIAGGAFDGVAFDSTGFNRGFIHLIYEE